MGLPAARSSLDLVRELEDAGAMSAMHLDLSSQADISLDTCEALAAFFGQLNNSSRWWIADLLLYVEMRYGEYVGHVANFTKLAPQTIENIISIGKRVPPSRRREGVTFSIHAEVASLPPNDQRHWLKVAAEERLTTAEFRARLRPELPPAVVARTVTCPHCGGEVTV